MTDLPLLVAPERLRDTLGDPALRVLDATVWLQLHPDGSEVTIESGRAAFEAGHIPGAGFADLIELSDPVRPAWFMLPEPERFAEEMSRLGVGPGTHVVVYDGEDGIWATRLWWMLRAFGFEAVSVLDGGMKAWRAAGLPISTETRDVTPAGFEARFRPELVATRGDVEALMGTAARVSSTRFRWSSSAVTPLSRPAASAIYPAASVFPTGTSSSRSRTAFCPSNGSVSALLLQACSIGHGW